MLYKYSVNFCEIAKLFLLLWRLICGALDGESDDAGFESGISHDEKP